MLKFVSTKSTRNKPGGLSRPQERSSTQYLLDHTSGPDQYPASRPGGLMTYHLHPQERGYAIHGQSGQQVRVIPLDYTSKGSVSMVNHVPEGRGHGGGMRSSASMAKENEIIQPHGRSSGVFSREHVYDHAIPISSMLLTDGRNVHLAKPGQSSQYLHNGPMAENIPDYDILTDSQPPPRRPLHLKPPIVPHRTRHVHMGRGTHGLAVCEDGITLRPGISYSQSIAHQRTRSPVSHRSPMSRDVHHVTWDPGIVNGTRQVPASIKLDHAGLEKRKKSPIREERGMLGIPKFPVDDSELEKSADHFTSDTEDEHFMAISTSPPGGTEVKKSKMDPNVTVIRPKVRYSHLTYVTQPMEYTPIGVPLGCEYIMYHPGSAVSNRDHISLGQGSGFHDIRVTPTGTASISDGSTTITSTTVSPSVYGIHSEKSEDVNNLFRSTYSQLQSPISSFQPPRYHSYSATRDHMDGLHYSSDYYPQYTPPETFDTFVTLGHPVSSYTTAESFTLNGGPNATSTPMSTLPKCPVYSPLSVHDSAYDNIEGRTQIHEIPVSVHQTYREKCSYKEHDSMDDDEVFRDADLLAPLLGSSAFTEDRMNKSARRSLDKYFQEAAERDVMTSCVPQLNQDLNNDTLNRNYPRVQPVPGGISSRSGTMSTLRDMIDRNQDPGGEDVILDLVYITERIISMSFVSETHENIYKSNLKEVTRMLKSKHGDHYLVLNISDKNDDLPKLCPQVVEYGWPDGLAPPLERLCSICKSIDSWMGSIPQNVVVIHCKGGRGRLAVVIAAYMRYTNICASADGALDRFALKRYYDDKLGGISLPSQRRYVNYFAGLLSGAIQINSNPLYLHHILIHGVPNFDTNGGCRPFIKVYQGIKAMFTSGVYNVTDNMQKVCISISPGIPLKGDILIKCYHKKNKAGQREIIWACQFHTCTISHNALVFSKQELDYAVNDPRFPDQGKVEFIFGDNSEEMVTVADFKSDVTVPVDDSSDNLVRWDSYEKFEDGEGKHDLEYTVPRALQILGAALISITVYTHVCSDTNCKLHRPRSAIAFYDGRSGSMLFAFGPGFYASIYDVNDNRVTSQEQVRSVKVINLKEHLSGPVDGSLYATINKRKLESGNVVQNGPSQLQNGTSYHTLESSHFGGSPMSTSDVRSYSSRDFNDQGYSTKYSTSATKSNYTTTTSPHSAVKVLDEQTQLDQILSDLLNNQAFVSPKSPPKSESETRTFKTFDSQMGPDGKVTIQRAEVQYKPEGYREERHFKKTEEKRSYQPVNAFTYTPSSPEMARSFEPIKSPEAPKTRTLPYRTDYENKYGESYSSYNTLNGPHLTTSVSDSEQSLSWLQQQQAKLREKHPDHDAARTHQEKMIIEELKSAQNRYVTKKSQSEEDERQIMDSYKKSPPPVTNGPVSATSPYSYTLSRTHTYSSEKSPSEHWRQQDFAMEPQFSYGAQNYFTESRSDGSKVSNKPPPSPQMQRAITPITMSPPVVPPARSSSKDYMQQQQQQQQRMRSNSGSNWQAQNSSSWTTSTQPRPVQRHHSETAYDREQSERQHASRSHSAASPASPRSLSPSQTYQTYKTVYKTIQHTTDQPDFVQPVSSPPRVSPTTTYMEVKPKQHYITEVYVHRTGGGSNTGTMKSVKSDTDKHDTESRLDELEKSLQAASVSIMASSPWQQSEQFKKSEVRQKMETRTYEVKTEQQFQKQQMSTVQTPPEPKTVREVEEDRITLRPIGPGVQTLEPEGSHTGTLSSHSGTLGRSVTPSFPTSSVASAETLIQAVHEKVRRMSLGSTKDLHGASNRATPPFPVTPRTPYYNTTAASNASQATYSPPTSNSVFERDNSYNAIVSRQLLRGSDPLYASIPEGLCGVDEGASSSGSHVTSSENQKMQYQTQQQTSHQYQYQTQQQQYTNSTQQQQQYGSTGPHGALHIDTSPKMISTGHIRSPSSAGSPPSPGSLNTLRQQLHVAHTMSGSAVSPGPHSATGQSSPSVYFGLSRRGSLTSLADSEAVHTTPRFVKDTSKFWYKPNITREEAIVILKDKLPGTFVVRDSNSFPGAFGLALKVAQIPPNVQVKPSGDPQADLVRHFLIEPTPKGVRLRGCTNEPVFGTLAALVYQHSITPLALPCKLVLPEADPAGDFDHVDAVSVPETSSSASALLAQGAACNVFFLNTVDTESLTGPQAVAQAMKVTFDVDPKPKTTIVHFKVSNQGITLTDNQRKLFFRRHYPVASVTFCGMDPEDRKWKYEDAHGLVKEAKVFGFVARKQMGVSDNECHLFAELDPDQPAAAIVNFVTKVMIGQSKLKS